MPAFAPSFGYAEISRPSSISDLLEAHVAAGDTSLLMPPGMPRAARRAYSYWHFNS